MITYIEDKSPKYPPRTYANVIGADATLAFAFDFNTAGEKLTKNACIEKSRQYYPLDVLKISHFDIGDFGRLVGSYNIKTVNIAGNSLPVAIKWGRNQIFCDDRVYLFFRHLRNEFGINFTNIRSGGQSGFDEAGIKAAIKLDIPAICHFPKGWKFLNEHGETICDEILFKKRFEI